MFRRCIPFFFRALLAFFLVGLIPGESWAHGPFDHNARVWVYADHLEATVTMGPEAAKGYLDNGPEAVLRSGHMEIAFPFPAASAARIFEIKAGDRVLEPTKTTVRSDGLEYVFGFICPRPDSGTLRLNPLYAAHTAHLTKGSLVVVDENDNMLAGKILTAEDCTLEFALPANAETNALVAMSPATNEAPVITSAIKPPAQTPSVVPSFGQFFKLGVEHILTGFDHLLFLCALLIGLRKLGPMLGVITGFTLAHSVTLALAATGVVSISSRIVEPIIAASIIVVAIENIWRRDATQDRYWLAGGFGLIHGFGFASALQATGLGHAGSSMVMPLFAFNSGVETGQLLVMAVVVPGLFLLRRWPLFVRYGSPAVATLIIILSGYWFLERAVFPR